MNSLKLAVVLGILLLFVIIGISMKATMHNTEARLRNKFEAKQEECIVVHDNTWKVIKQVAQVPEAAASKFEKIYPALMQGRYGNARGGALLSFITESNPDFGSIAGLYEKVSNAIEANRATLVKKETELLDVQREYNTMLDGFFYGMFGPGGERLKAKVVASTKSRESFDSGVEDNVDDLFGEK